jgi:hypothetical protein
MEDANLFALRGPLEKGREIYARLSGRKRSHARYYDDMESSSSAEAQSSACGSRGRRSNR